MLQETEDDNVCLAVVQVAQERPDVRYNLLAVDFMPEEVLSMHLGNAAAGLARGSLTPLTRVCHRLKGVVGALRQMSQAQHVGKVVVTRHLEDPMALRTRGAIAISGGTGMIGQVMAMWLLETQVRNWRHQACHGLSLKKASAILHAMNVRVLLPRSSRFPMSSSLAAPGAAVLFKSCNRVPGQPL